MRISDHMTASRVHFAEKAESKGDVLRLLTDQMAGDGAITDAQACLTALLEREKLMTTGVGKGVALPHAFSAAVPNTAISYLRLAEGVDFDAVDESPVHHIFCILGPVTAQGRHLKILARLARLLNHDSFIEALAGADTSEAVLEVLQSQEAALEAGG